MSDPNVDMCEGARTGALSLLARAAAADLSARHATIGAIDDFFMDDSARLDERTRVALGQLLRALVETVEGEIRGHGVRLLRARGEGAAADALAEGQPVLPRLMRRGVLRDPELMAELIGRTRQELLASALQPRAQDDPDRPSLINRFVEHPDRVLAQGAMALLIAESRRRGPLEPGRLAQTDLPAELHHRLAWLVAAALRDEGLAEAEALTALDATLAEAAQRSLMAHDEGSRLEAAAMRLAAAIDAGPDDLADLMAEALGDRRVTLFAALLGHALGIDYAAARDLTLDAVDGRLWLALRALGFGREAIARIGVALTEADPRSDLERFADTLDMAMAVTPDEGRGAIASLRLPGDYRAAVLRLGERRR
ncbi:DUF2336 domain-containing protein [Sphingomonas sp.]|uniref:DUF2336 domain-containing protein n=1 Tax=Sphingomonas sp. TaxID=28214 RepID=UPI001EB884E6|nr:DUF2336 domain-containing protein [Sphingomonas sp.]MBX3593087.1 DUF2336 domain-containing protein [Sphingomonas sp.]